MSAPRPPLSLAKVRALDRAAFVEHFAEVLDDGAWIAERAWAQGPFDDVAALHGAIVAVIRQAGEQRQLALLRAHPDLGDRLAVADATSQSRGEQSGAGLDRLSAEQYARFQALNAAYREKFGFPFIVAVKGLDAQQILRRFERRLGHTRAAELAQALEEVARIARFRLDTLIDPRH